MPMNKRCNQLAIIQIVSDRNARDFWGPGDWRHPCHPAGKAIRACDAPLQRLLSGPFRNITVHYTPKENNHPINAIIIVQ
jgi:hypothetical protein